LYLTLLFKVQVPYNVCTCVSVPLCMHAPAHVSQSINQATVHTRGGFTVITRPSYHCPKQTGLLSFTYYMPQYLRGPIMHIHPISQTAAILYIDISQYYQAARLTCVWRATDARPAYCAMRFL